jgi:hypothetical protein
MRPLSSTGCRSYKCVGLFLHCPLCLLGRPLFKLRDRLSLSSCKDTKYKLWNLWTACKFRERSLLHRLLPISAAAEGTFNVFPFRSEESCGCSLQTPQGSKLCNSCSPHVSKVCRLEGKSCSLMHWPVIRHWCTTSDFVNLVHDLPRLGLSCQSCFSVDRHRFLSGMSA